MLIPSNTSLLDIINVYNILLFFSHVYDMELEKKYLKTTNISRLISQPQAFSKRPWAEYASPHLKYSLFDISNQNALIR